jgi:hypothetical protein
LHINVIVTIIIIIIITTTTITLIIRNYKRRYLIAAAKKETRIKHYKTVTIPILTYSFETWSLIEMDMRVYLVVIIFQNLLLTSNSE